jgi:hypothetical protein
MTDPSLSTGLERRLRTLVSSLERQAFEEMLPALKVIATGERGPRPAAAEISAVRALLADPARRASLVGFLERLDDAIVEANRETAASVVGSSAPRQAVQVDPSRPRGGPLARLLFLGGGS